MSEYCSIGPDGKRVRLSLGEKEQLFLEAMSSYYIEGRATLSDAEFENLKEDLVWQGSKVAVLSSDEQRFLEAQLAFNRGKPIMTDGAAALPVLLRCLAGAHAQPGHARPSALTPAPPPPPRPSRV